MGTDRKAAIIEAIYQRVPYSHQIRNLDLASEDDAVRFDWRGTRYRVTTHGDAEEVGDGVLSNSDSAILLEALIRGSRA